MGALVIGYIIGSIVAIPFLAYHLLRTRRDLNALRAELAARGFIALKIENSHFPAVREEDVRPLASGVDPTLAPEERR
jgi:predicted aconitase